MWQVYKITKRLCYCNDANEDVPHAHRMEGQIAFDNNVARAVSSSKSTRNNTPGRLEGRMKSKDLISSKRVGTAKTRNGA